MTDGWGARPGTGATGQTGSWAYPSPDGPDPARYHPAAAAPGASPWWSDALADPWRDPAAPAAVIITPPSAAPALEPVEPAAPAATGARHGLGLVLAVAMATALLAGALGGTLGYVFASRNGVGAGQPLGGGQAAGQLTQREPDSLAGVVKKVLPSVVTIKVRSGNGFSLGSGFVASTDGYVITNDHVVAGASGAATVTFSDGSSVTGRVAGHDSEADVAVIKVDKVGLPAVEFGNSDAVQVGDPVLAIGSPLALANTVTFGIVSAVDRPIEAGDPGGTKRYYAAIQTDAAVNHGNSGGPLFDVSGRVIGINSVIKSVAESAEQAGNVGLAFAIPINQAKRLAEEIIDSGQARRTVIGAELEGSYRSANGGVRLAGVEAGGPAANAGLQPGDVLTRLEGRPLEEPADLIALVRKYAPGAGVNVEYVRAGARSTARVTLVADAK